MNLLNRSFQRFIKSLTKGYEVESAKDKKFKFPLELVSKSYDVAGVFVFSLAKERGLAYLYIEAGDENISNLINLLHKIKGSNLFKNKFLYFFASKIFKISLNK